jgi:predicted ATP-grasp superfamily ATP-dependent carboligase
MLWRTTRFADEILGFIKKFGCNFIVTIGGVPTSEEKTQVYVAATSPRLAMEFMEKGAVLYSKGRIAGANGFNVRTCKGTWPRRHMPPRLQQQALELTGAQAFQSSSF